MKSSLRALSALIVTTTVSGCGLFGSTSTHQISAVSLVSGKITAYDFSNGVAGDVLSETTFDNRNKDSDGNNLSLDLGKSDRPVLIELTEARVEDWATLETLSFDTGDKWMTLRSAISEATELVISPLTTISACHSIHSIQQMVKPNIDTVKQIIGTSQAVFSEHLASIDFLSLEPTPLNAPVGNIMSNVKQSLFLAGFSQVARDYSIKAGLTPNKVLNIISLTEALCDDVLEDRILDGQDALGTIQVAGVDITDRTLRIDLAMGMIRFLGNTTVNKSGIGSQDVMALGNEIATNIDPNLFPQGVPVFSIDLDPPEVSVMQPLGSNPVISGIADIRVLATDAGSDVADISVALMRFGPSFVPVSDLEDTNSASALFEAALVTNIFDNGSYLLSITSNDLLGNRTVKTFDLTINN